LAQAFTTTSSNDDRGGRRSATTIDQIYYEYKDTLWSKKCYEETDVVTDGVYAEELTIQCNIMTPYAHLQICLVDDVTKNFLSSEYEDDADVPKCCHHDDPNNENNKKSPTVCYTLQISCETKCADTTVDHRSRRLLRGSGGMLN